MNHQQQKYYSTFGLASGTGRELDYSFHVRLGFAGLVCQNRISYAGRTGWFGFSRNLLAVLMLLAFSPLWSEGLLADTPTPCTPAETEVIIGGELYKVLSFTDTGECTWEVPEGVTEVEYLIVGGGGGAGSGGGGGGGFFEGSHNIISSSYTILVGSGGAVSTGGGVRGGDGGNSNVFDISAGGGGGGGRSPSSTINGRAGLFNGGSGGGAGASGGIDGNGGNGNGSGGNGASNNRAENRGGGGGGAGGNASGFNGGVGLTSSITGTALFYAGGGASQGSPGQGTPGTGQDGPGGGGNAFSDPGFEKGKDGVVIIRYLFDTRTRITNWEELHNMRMDLSGDYVLANDLGPDSPGYNTYASETANSGAGWEPIGTDATPFTGTFNGKGHTISGLVIDRPDTDDAGLFGVVQTTGMTPAQVTNLRLSDARITARDFTGALVGRTLSAGISQVHLVSTDAPGSGGPNTAQITGRNSTGGLAGRLTGGTLTRSSAEAELTTRTGGTATGGLAGELRGSAAVSQSYALGTLDATDGTGDGGGLVGLLTNLAMVADSYALVQLHGPTAAEAGQGTGGLVGRMQGDETYVITSYAAAPSITSNGPRGGLIGLNSAFDATHEPAPPPDPFTPPVPSTPPNVIASFWDAERSGLGGINSTAGSQGGIGLGTLTMKVQATYTVTSEPVLDQAWDISTGSGSSTWQILGPGEDGSTVSYPFLRDAAPADGSEPGRIDFPFASGAGTLANPFLIETWTHLDNVRHHRQTVYRLDASLTSGTGDYTGLAGVTANDGKGWEPIGTDADPFLGIFDGNGHTISDVIINRNDDTDPGDDTPAGLFGVLERSPWLVSRIHNLTLTEANVNGLEDTGALAGLVRGYSDEGTRYPFVLEDLLVTDAQVSGTERTGGLIGTGTQALLERISVSVADEPSVTIASTLNAGGVAGTLDNSTLTASRALVSIGDGGRAEGLTQAGGLVGRLQGATQLSRSYAIAHIDGSRGEGDIGGLAGRAEDVSAIRDTYALGTVAGPLSADESDANRGTGGLVGHIANDEVTLFRSYAATEELTAFENLGGLVGRNTGPGGGISGEEGPPLPGETGNVINAFWDAELSGVGLPDSEDASAGGMGLSTLRMKNISSFTDTDRPGLDDAWDISAEVDTSTESVWKMLVYNESASQSLISYPYLTDADPNEGDATENEPGRDEFYYEGGFGTEADPFRLSSWRHLHFVGEYPSAFFALVGNLDQTSDFYSEFAASGADGGRGWRPITGDGVPFTGTFQGNGHTIRDFVSNRPDEDHLGLFGWLGADEVSQALVENLVIAHAQLTGRERVGALAGRITGSVLHQPSVSQTSAQGVTLVAANQAGGLAGTAQFGTFSELAAESAIEGEPGSETVTPLTVRAGSRAGGLFGELSGGTLADSYARATLEGQPGVDALSTAGGLAGVLTGSAEVERVFAESVLDGRQGEGDIGGLIGFMGGQTRLRDAYSISSVTGPNAGTARPDRGTGGLVGRVQGLDNTITNTYAATPVLLAAINRGGLVGYNDELAALSGGTGSRDTDETGSDELIPPLPGLPTNVFNSFWDVRLSGVGFEDETAGSYGGTGKSTFILKVEPTFTDTDEPGLDSAWDFVSESEPGATWRILSRESDSGFVSYPYLRTVDPGSENEPGRFAFGFAGGFGTVEEPFEIELWQHLSNIRHVPDMRFVLNEDLNEDTTDYTGLADPGASAGKGWEPIGTPSEPFSGYLDGNDKTIADFEINRPDEDHTGLFGYIAGTDEEPAIIKNLTLENISVTGRDHTGGLAGLTRRAFLTRVSAEMPGFKMVTGRKFVGGLIGSGNGTSIIESFALGNVVPAVVSAPLTDAGLLAGLLAGSSLAERSFANGVISAATSEVAGSGNIGGLVGRIADATTLRDVYAIASVTGANDVADETGTGGLVGSIDHPASSVINAYAVNAVLQTGETGGGPLGGLIGRNPAAGGIPPPGSIPPLPGLSGNVINSFWDSDVSGIGTPNTTDGSAGGTAKSTRLLTNAVTFTTVEASPGLVEPVWEFECFVPVEDAVWGVTVPEDVGDFVAINEGYPHLKWRHPDSETVIVNIGDVCYGTLQLALAAIDAGEQTGDETTDEILVVVNGDQLVTGGQDLGLNPGDEAPASYSEVTIDFMPRRSLTIDDGATFTLGENHKLRLREALFIDGEDSRLHLQTGFTLLKDDAFLPQATLSDQAILEVQPAVVLDIAPFFDTVTTTGDAFILLRNGALYRNTTDQPIELKVERQLGKEGEDDYSQFGWRMISSPVGTTYEDLFGGLVTQGFAGATFVDEEVYSPNVIWYEEEDGGTAFQSWRVPDGITATIPTGRGYFYYNFDGNTRPTDFVTRYEDELPRTISTRGAEPVIESSGFDFGVTYTERKSSLSEPAGADTVFIDYSTAESGWNLIGNPTASVLNWGLVGDENWTKTNMSNAIYIWDPLKEDFEVFNGIDMGDFDGRLAPYQGFWVQATDENPKLEFTNGAKIIESADFIGGDDAAPSSMGQPVDDPMILRFTIDAAGMQTRTWLMFSDEGRTGLDPMDAFRLEPMSDTWISASTAMQHGEPSLAINHLPARFEEQLSLPFYVGAAINSEPWSGELQLRWELSDNWPSNQQITLMDHERREAIRLTDGSQTVYDAQFSTPGSQMPPAYVNTMALFSPDTRYAFTANAASAPARTIDGSGSAQRSSGNAARNATATATAPNRRSANAASGRRSTASQPQAGAGAGIERPSIVVGLPSRLVSASGRSAASTDEAVGTDGFGLQSGTSGGEGNLSGAIGDQEKPRFSIVIHPTSDEPTYIPLEAELYQNYPNPFNPSTTIRFALPEQQRVRIEVFDVLGRRVERLNDGVLGAGTHSFTWDASGLASGIYFVRLATDTSVLTRGMTLIK